MKNASQAAGNVTDAGPETGPTLQRGLKNRHIQLIALGGAIGTGLFLGIGRRFKWPGLPCCWVTVSPGLSLS